MAFRLVYFRLKYEDLDIYNTLYSDYIFYDTNKKVYRVRYISYNKENNSVRNARHLYDSWLDIFTMGIYDMVSHFKSLKYIKEKRGKLC